MWGVKIDSLKLKRQVNKLSFDSRTPVLAFNLGVYLTDLFALNATNDCMSTLVLSPPGIQQSRDVFHIDQFSHLRSTRCSFWSLCWRSLSPAPVHTLGFVRALFRWLVALLALQGLHTCVRLCLHSCQGADSEFSALLWSKSQSH